MGWASPWTERRLPGFLVQAAYDTSIGHGMSQCPSAVRFDVQCMGSLPLNVIVEVLLGAAWQPARVRQDL